VRFCNACVKRTRRLRCGCGRATITMRRRKEWEILCELTKHEPYDNMTASFQTVAGLWELVGNGIGKQEMKTIVRGLAREGLAHIENAHNGLRVYRIPGALIEFHLGGGGATITDALDIQAVEKTSCEVRGVG